MITENYSAYPKARNYITEFRYKCAIFARHPATRLVSAFINKKLINYNKRRLVYFDDLEGFSQKLVTDRIFTSLLGRSIDQYNGITFNEFLDHLERAILIDGPQINNHLGHSNSKTTTSANAKM